MSFINTIDVLGDELVVKQFIERTLAEFKDNGVTSVGGYAFYGCSNLTTVDLPLVTSVGSYAFYNCKALTTVILRYETRCTLSDVKAFNSTPIKSGTGYIYVPSALVDSYKADSKWSTYANQFRALEDYTVDGTITGELDTNKI